VNTQYSFEFFFKLKSGVHFVILHVWALQYNFFHKYLCVYVIILLRLSLLLRHLDFFPFFSPMFSAKFGKFLNLQATLLKPVFVGCIDPKLPLVDAAMFQYLQIRIEI